MRVVNVRVHYVLKEIDVDLLLKDCPLSSPFQLKIYIYLIWETESLIGDNWNNNNNNTGKIPGSHYILGYLKNTHKILYLYTIIF